MTHISRRPAELRTAALRFPGPIPYLQSHPTGFALLAVVLGSIGLLTGLRIADGPAELELFGQAVLACAFVGLAVIDLRLAVAVVLFELAMGGARGAWTEFPGEVAGRVFLLGVVTVRAAVTFAVEWKRSGRLDLGRYGPHALALAVIIPGVWMGLGLNNGYPPSDVFGDGNGLMGFALVLPVVALIQRGSGPWLRECFFFACVGNALLTGALIALSTSGLAPVDGQLSNVLVDEIETAWAVGHMPNGAYRLYLASGLFLQIGLAFTASRLLTRPTVWLWLLWGLLWVDVIATYTRGLWVGAALAVVLTVALAYPRARPAIVLAAATAAMFIGAIAVTPLWGFSLDDYVLNRGASIASTDLDTQDLDTHDVDEGADIGGRQSNVMKVEQAKVLVRKIEERPIFGHGFGAIATEYEFASSYSYELSYLNIPFKTGIVGLLLFISFPLRVLFDAARVRLGRIPPPPRVARHELGVVIAYIVSVLLTGATNPYVLAAFGIAPIVLAVAWLEHGPKAAPTTATARRDPPLGRGADH